jgi:DNA-directed RNA polymerase subunit E'/Rpb7
MNKISSIILLTISGLVILVVGGGIGVAYQLQKQQVINAGVTNNCTSNSTVKTLSSQLIHSIIVSGTVTNVSGENITVSDGNTTAVVTTIDTVQVYSFTKDKNEKTSQVKDDFSHIKKGDNINANCVLSPKGILEGEAVFILPTSPANSTATNK